MDETQQEINDDVLIALTGLTEAMKTSSQSRDVVMKLLQFEGSRIDKLENKVDLLMTLRKQNDI